MPYSPIPTGISYGKADLPSNLEDLVTPNYYFGDSLNYGNHPKKNFDIIVPEHPEGEKVPLVIFVHGGGFFSGKKETAYSTFAKRQIIAGFLNDYIAFASINYRLLNKDPEKETMGLKKCLFDIRECLQVIRFHADVFNLDKAKVVLWGVSAGAGASLWLAFNPDMKDTSKSDYRKESTRVRAVWAQQTQASYHLGRWASDIFSYVSFVGGGGGGISLACIRDILGVNEVKSYYHITTSGIPSEAAIVAAADGYEIANGISLDLLNPALMTPDDPPSWIEHGNVLEPFPADICTAPYTDADKQQLNHHPYHSRALHQAADLQNNNVPPEVKYVARIPILGIDTQHGLAKIYLGKEAPEFLRDRLV